MNRYTTLIRIVVAALLLSLGACATTQPCRDCAGGSDEKISEQIRSALFQRPDFVGSDISVQTRDGVVYLHGLIDSTPLRDDAVAIAQRIPGVKRVVNSIEIRSGNAR